MVVDDRRRSTPRFPGDVTQTGINNVAQCRALGTPAISRRCGRARYGYCGSSDCVIDHRCLVPPTTPTNTREISKTPGLLHKSASPATRLHHASDKSYYKSPAFPHTLARRAANGGGGGRLFYVVGGIDSARRGWAPRVSNSTVRRVCQQLLPVNDHSASS